MKTPVRQLVVAFIVGLLFAVGLALSGMTLPSKVIGFFDFSRGLDSWDPSLAFVMGGGMLVYFPAFRIVRKQNAPRFTELFRVPSRSDITPRLVGGAALFGLGWGLGGFCPGPAITSVGALSGKAAIMVVSMFVGMFLFQKVDEMMHRAASEKAPEEAAEPSAAATAKVS